MMNSLFLRRLVIYTNEGKIAYDETFHRGINIICGDNSSGKSTITHFIFFVLGGGFSDFIPEVRECQEVYAELEVNELVFTIRRNIEVNENTNNINSKAPMYFFWGDFEEALNPPQNKYWNKYQYNTTSKKKSFSNVLFELLEIPEVKEENNITIHQILRLLYIDQESPTSSLFYYEPFDSQSTREAVADLLLGVYNQDLYTYKLELQQSQKKLEEVKSEIKITKKFFPNDFYLDKRHLNTHIENNQKRIINIDNEINDIRKGIQKVEFNNEQQLEFQKLQKETAQERSKLVKLQNEIIILQDNIIDSEYFIEALNDKYRALRNSIQTREFLGGIPIDYCPECLNKLNKTSKKNCCKLCKQEIDDTFGITQARRMQLEIKFQIEESEKLLEIRKEELKEKEILLKSKREKVNILQKKVNNSIVDIRPFELEKLDNLNYQKGIVEGEIMQLRTLLEQALKYEHLIEEKGILDKRIYSLGSKISTIRKEQDGAKKRVIGAIQKEGVYLLNNDFERQREFTNAEPNDLIIDFSNNIVYLKTNNLKKYKQYQKFSASSNFYLKVSARFAIFLASLVEPNMRFPRFIFADNMEDKGIEIERAQNLQRILIERINKLDKEQNHQIIYTTSYITDELKDSDYVVGEYYTENNRSLKHVN
ncbi:hypothetical protein [Ornithobacterium rhinotracheale]